MIKTPQFKLPKPPKQEVEKHPQLKDYTKKKMKNDIDSLTKTITKLTESIDTNDVLLNAKKIRLEKLKKDKEELTLLNNQF